MPLFTGQPTSHYDIAYDLLSDTANSVAATANTVVSYLEPTPHETFNSTCATCHAYYHRNFGMAPPQPSVSRKAVTTMHNHPYDAACNACEAEKRRNRSTDWILAVLAVLCPPGVAYIKTGKRDLWLNVILTLFGWAPGMLHAWYLIILHPGVHHRHEQVWRETDPECYRPEDDQCNGHRDNGHPIAVPVAASAPVTSAASTAPTGDRLGGHWRDSKDTPPSYGAS